MAAWDPSFEDANGRALNTWQQCLNVNPNGGVFVCTRAENHPGKHACIVIGGTMIRDWSNINYCAQTQPTTHPAPTKKDVDDWNEWQDFERARKPSKPVYIYKPKWPEKLCSSHGLKMTLLLNMFVCDACDAAKVK